MVEDLQEDLPSGNDSDAASASGEKQTATYARDVHELLSKEQENTRVLEETLAKLNNALEQARQFDRLREELVSNISHELRTPLTPILGWSKMICDRPDVTIEQAREFAQTIHANAERLGRLVVSLLRIASILQDARAPDRRRVGVPALLASAAIEAREAGRQVNIEVVNGVDWIETDRDITLEVLHHLVENALKFSPIGSEITMMAAQNRDDAVFSIINESEGDPEHIGEAIFDLFVQGEGGLTRRVGGVGSGLFICRKLLGALGGRIWVEPATDGKTQFSFTLPLATS